MDSAIKKVVNDELKRQRSTIELIASENFVSNEVLAVTGSLLTNKYAEGYPGKRYYGGCAAVDVAENLALDRVKRLFGCAFANVQPHSGTSANLAVYAAVLKPGDKVLAMSLDAGGHLTHGHRVSQSGVLYDFKHYGVDPVSQRIDTDAVRKLALSHRPRLIVAGASNYSRTIDFAAFGAIAKEVGALLMVDMAHIAGLICAGEHPSPFPYADIVTSTTHKTLRGPRGAFVLCNDPELAKAIDKAVFPGTQGGPLMHVIAAKAVAFGDALKPEFKRYARKVVGNARAFSAELARLGAKIVSGGTDNHLFTVDVGTSYALTGKRAEEILDAVGITANKNAIPFDPLPPSVTSGLRVGVPAMTTRGFGAKEFVALAGVIDAVLRYQSPGQMREARRSVKSLLAGFPLYGRR